MNVRELIEELENFDDNMEVHFSYNYGDHWRTTVAPIAENVDEGLVKHSGYHEMDMVVDEDHDNTEGTKEVVIISAQGEVA